MRKPTKLDLPLGLALLSGSFLLGGLLGFFLSTLLAQENGLSQYFHSYFTLVEAGELTPHFGNSLWSNLKTPLLAFLFGFSFLGILGLPLLFVTEGFLFTFSVSSMCRLLGAQGLLPGFFLFCLPALIWIPILFLLGQQSFRSAILLAGQGRRLSEEIYPKGYFIRCFFCIFATLLMVGLEYFVIPVLLQASLPFHS